MSISAWLGKYLDSEASAYQYQLLSRQALLASPVAAVEEWEDL